MKKIPPFKLIMKPLDNAAKDLPGFKWTDRLIDKRHKLGGEPDFIQKEDWPMCPECGLQMTFYGQLDSINDDFCIADCGIIYIFLCFDCNKAISIIQSY